VLITWDEGLHIREPQFFATRAEASAARPKDGSPYSVVNAARTPRHTIRSVSEVLARKYQRPPRE